MVELMKPTRFDTSVHHQCVHMLSPFVLFSPPSGAPCVQSFHKVSSKVQKNLQKSDGPK